MSAPEPGSVDGSSPYPRRISADHAPVRPASPRRRQRGLTIIDLMVGIVIAMLVSLAATNSAVMFTAAQRSGVGSGGAIVNSTTALAALKNDASLAGLGFVGDGRMLCNGINLSVGSTMVSDGAAFTPLLLTTGPAADRIDIFYGTSIEAGATVRLATPSQGAGAELQSLLPVAVGQAVLLSPELPGDPCIVRSATANVAATPTVAQTLSFAAAGRHNARAFTNNVSYPDRARVTALGELRWNRYRLDNGNLILERPLDGTQAVLAHNVITLRAQYGISAAAAGSTTLEAWQNATGPDFSVLGVANINRVRALRVGLVTRSAQREKPGPDGVCTASLAKPLLFGVVVEPDVAEWQCYRYRAAVVVVPLRNLVMGFRS